MGKTFLSDEGLLYKQRPQKLLTVLERELVEPTYFTDEELYANKGTVLVFDLEIFPNYFLAAFKQYHPSMFDPKTLNMIEKDGVWEPCKVVTFELYPGKEVFNTHKLLWVIHNYTLVGFNSLKFDIPILYLALHGGSLEDLSESVEMIIQRGAQPRDIEERFKFKMGSVNHVDLIEVAPLSASLKAYMARLHAPRLQELPYEPTKYLSEVEAHKVKMYCVNDLDGTALLCRELEPQLELRAAMSAEYKMDLRSKSDAQIAEAVICKEIQRLSNYYPRRPKVAEGFKVKYQLPSFIKFESDLLNDVVNKLVNAEFALDHLGSPMWPEGLGVKEKTKDGKDKWVLKLKIGKATYTVGMGGLHSTEKNVTHIATDEIEIADNDVESFYPRIILNQLLAPEHLKAYFIEVYNAIVERRLEAKHLAKVYKKKGDRVQARHYKRVADSLKIVINGSFGKLGNKYSALYAPQLMLQVTLTGQLVLLMLIERLEAVDIEVISGNTDGIVSKYHKSRREEVRAVIKEWEIETCFITEETKYLATYSRDVNNYYTTKEDSCDPEAKFLDEQLGVKVKGCFAERGSALNSVLSKNPEFLILSDAVMNYLAKGIPIADTIRSCKDITRFTTVRTVKGGAEKDGVYLGKLVRFYYAKGCTGNINYVLSGNKVPKSESGKPCLDLPLVFPDDVNYERYIEEATSILYDVGFLQTSVQESFF